MTDRLAVWPEGRAATPGCFFLENAGHEAATSSKGSFQNFSLGGKKSLCMVEMGEQR